MVSHPPDPSPSSLSDRADARLIAGDLAGAVDLYVAALAERPDDRVRAKRFAIALGELGHEALAGRLQQALKQASLVEYQLRVERLRRSVYLDVPRHVHLETLARCNARCTFCPSPVLARKGARLDDTVLNKIIEDLTDIPSHIPFQLSPFKVNEPLLDVRLFDLLDTVKEKLPNARLALTTNGSPLTRKKLAALSRYPTLKTLYVSFNDHREAEYEAVMGLPYGRTLERLDTLHAAVAAGIFPGSVCVSRVGDGSPNDDAFRLWCAARWPQFRVLVSARGDWLGQVDIAPAWVPQVGCVRWFELSITATGTVAHCCMDGQADFPIGDVREQHVLEIYNGTAYRRLREAILTRQGASPCNTCTYL